MMANTTADKLAKLAETKSNIKQAIIEKGIDVSDTDTFASYAGKIGQISGGGIPSYVPPKEIVNGALTNPVDVTSYSIAPATDVGNYVLYYGFYKRTGLTSVDLSSLATVSGNSGLSNCFYNCTGLTSVDLSSLATVSGDYAMNHCFSGCTGLTTLELSSLTTLSGSNAMNYCFQGCGNLTSINLSALETVSGDCAMNYCFEQCRNLTSVEFPALTTISGSNGMAYCFQACSKLTSVEFPALTTISGRNAFHQCFVSCSNLNISFPALRSFGTFKDQFYWMLAYASGCTLHFPSNMQSAVEGLTGYPNFSGTNTVILFDLPPTA